uniref:Uncharacterized protein n=1 Tax=Knipowitschia caucasica TaxID=637954 RepID=A0AAV2K2W7_KNICA
MPITTGPSDRRTVISAENLMLCPGWLSVPSPGAKLPRIGNSPPARASTSIEQLPDSSSSKARAARTVTDPSAQTEEAGGLRALQPNSARRAGSRGGTCLITRAAVSRNLDVGH